jgi:HPt (histidine-containing phosphotransfer) domain-containing protein
LEAGTLRIPLIDVLSTHAAGYNDDGQHGRGAEISNLEFPVMSVQSESTSSVLDSEQALARLGGDRQLYEELIGFVFEDTPLLLAELDKAVEDGDAAAVRMKAHSIKGLVAGCGGVRSATIAHKVEIAGEQGDFTEINSQVAALREELDVLMDALRHFSA